MYTYELSLQLDGLGTADIPKEMNNVYFQNISGLLHASTRVESESKDETSKEILQRATQHLDEAIVRLSFMRGTKVSLSGNGYVVKRLFDHKHPWTILSILNSAYSIDVNHDKLAEDISSLTYEMNFILNNALGYYEAAMESTNLYVRTVLLVSCASALIKDVHQIKQDLGIKDLKMGLDKIRKNMNMNEGDFRDLIDRIYGGRSRSAHGNIDIKSGTALGFLTEDFKKFHQMVRELIKDFIKRNQGNLTTIPKN